MDRLQGRDVLGPPRHDCAQGSVIPQARDVAANVRDFGAFWNRSDASSTQPAAIAFRKADRQQINAAIAALPVG